MALNRGVLDLFINQTACLSRAERFNSGLKASKSSMRAGKTPWAFLLLTTASQVVDIIRDLHAFSALLLHCIVRRIETVCEWSSWTVIYSSLTDHWARSICHSHHLFLPKFFPYISLIYSCLNSFLSRYYVYVTRTQSWQSVLLWDKHHCCLCGFSCQRGPWARYRVCFSLLSAPAKLQFATDWSSFVF